MRVASLAVTLLAAAGMSWGCLSSSCSSASCQPGISAKVVGGLPTAESARACLGDDCVETTWPVSAHDCTNGSEPPLALSVCLDDDGAMVRLTFEEAVELDDGVRFELVVEDASGEVLLSESERVTFTDSYPNGRDCPGHCRYANYRY